MSVANAETAPAYVRAEKFMTREAARCMLCDEAPCTEACPRGQDPAAMLFSLHFDDPALAGAAVNMSACLHCDAPCQAACIHYDFPVRIRDMSLALEGNGQEPDSADLSIDFCGVHCENPFFLSSSVVASNYDMCASALRQGWAGIVYKTIGFYIADEVSPRFSAVGKEATPFVGFRNLEQISDHPLTENLDILRRLKRDFPTKIIVASIMGRNDGEWTELARLCTDAGVDIIECNFSCPQMAFKGMGSDVGQNPELVREYTAAVRKGTKLPVLAKMTPNVGNIEPPAIAAVDGGANGLAAINTVKSITGLNLENLAAPPDIAGKSAVSGYSGKAVKPIALRFIHDMAVCDKLKCVPLSGMGGIETWRDAAEFLALGCSNLQITTAVMQYGYGIINDLKAGLGNYLKEHGYAALPCFCGSALPNMVSSDELDRSTVVYPVIDRNACIGCGRCFISCRDGGHQAISFDTATRRPRLLARKCVGCHLCRLVCPSEAIGVSKRVAKSGRGESC